MPIEERIKMNYNFFSKETERKHIELQNDVLYRLAKKRGFQ